ncbi:Vesicular glutamate transporter 3 VGluT3, Solute carrier family 17 member 8 [Salmonella enterica subsp. enterica]|uniref:Vesicular glutamate transporter 3 VGluT3, Solute carrier family 17 member 8 n=1 Tax=Salmonella enterica I TaxID=59201 RepID=A0A447PVI0_SALET|nr:Vesicular glutamate transporter 3 VGluT3, Solute carrier family 17 member 8 [Salmonella enterica subsp. enterica]
MTSMQKWLRIGATLMFGLFVAYLDRSNPFRYVTYDYTHDLNIDGATASIVLTIFLIGYAFSNIFWRRIYPAIRSEKK